MLTGTNSYTGATTVESGMLVVNGVLSGSAVTVTNGTLSGNGLIQGSVVIQPGGALAPGTSIGSLTVSNSLSLGGTTVMELNATLGTNDSVRGLASVVYGGTLSLSNLAGNFSAPAAFKLFSANSYGGAFTAVTPASPGPGLGWNTYTLASDGTLRVVSTAPVTLSNLFSGDILSLSWPADHTGWRLQMQSNVVAAGLGTQWFDVTNGATTNQMFFGLDQKTGSVFYRLVYP